MNRPKRLKILGKPYSITYVPAGDPGLREGPTDNDPGVGRCDETKQCIYIEEGQPLENEQDTVLHEVLHAVEDAMGMDVAEDVVLRFATGLLAVIKDNPRFLSYLRSKKSETVQASD